MLPTFLIIGAMKSGTTSLYHYLRRHPEIYIPRRKEMSFFSHDNIWENGLDWYKSFFDTHHPIRGDATPSYTKYSMYPKASERIGAILPDVKLIYILRHPIDRLLSQYAHSVAGVHENRSFSEVYENMLHEECLITSKYMFQLQLYLRYFSLDQFYITTSERLHERRYEVLREIFTFLGADPNFTSPIFDKDFHRTRNKRMLTTTGRWLAKQPPFTFIDKLPNSRRYQMRTVSLYPFTKPIQRPTLTPAQYDHLKSLLDEDVQQLRALLDYPFDEWDW